MFNNQPGQGLGFAASKEIAHGLGMTFIVIIRTEIIRLISYITKLFNLNSLIGR